MRTETVVRVRGAEEISLQTLCPAEPWMLGQPGHHSRNPVVTGWQLYLADGADLIAGDQVRVREVAYTVLGAPAAWRGAGVVAQVGDLWTAQCTIRRPSGAPGTFDPAAGTYTSTPPDPHYTGGCQVSVMSPAEQQQLFAEELVTEVGYIVVVDIDVSTDCQVGDLVHITANDAHGDPMLIGQTLQLRSFARGSLPWERDLRCTFSLPTD